MDPFLFSLFMLIFGMLVGWVASAIGDVALAIRNLSHTLTEIHRQNKPAKRKR